jgi:formylglycine-generating enzyme required for sulfatase activity
LPAYLIDKNEVTWRQYGQFASDENLPQPPAPVWGRKDNYPASFILLEEARQFCAWAGGRLPTEAEWEKAARGTDGRAYPWGDAWDPTRCNSIYGGLHQPEPSGSMPRCVSPWGVLDMVGNVQEWAAEPFRDYPGAEVQPGGRYASHVTRGGGWMIQPAWVRTAFRQRRGPDSRLMDNGFRCVRDAPEATP